MPDTNLNLHEANPPFPNNSQLEIYPSTAPPSYEQSKGIFPSMPDTNLSMPDTNLSMPETNLSMPETNLTMHETDPPFPNNQAPLEMEKHGVKKDCGNCHNRVNGWTGGKVDVDSSVNKFGIAWFIVSICFFWPFAFFVMCIDCFRTWRHTCSSCGNLITEFTPKASGGTICGLVCTAVIVISFYVYIYVMVLPTWFAVIPEGFPESIPKRFPEGFPQGFPQDFPEGFPKGFPEGFPQGFPEGFPLGFPEGFLQGSPQGFPQGFPKDFTKVFTKLSELWYDHMTTSQCLNILFLFLFVCLKM